jgi:hypothetical protein
MSDYRRCLDLLGTYSKQLQVTTVRESTLSKIRYGMQ